MIEDLVKIKHKKTGEIKFFAGTMGARTFIQNNILPERKFSDWMLIN